MKTFVFKGNLEVFLLSLIIASVLIHHDGLVALLQLVVLAGVLFVTY